MKKTVLITGASSGFGKEAAKLFAGNDWNVIATMRTPENSQDLAAFNNILIQKLDVQDEDTIRIAINEGIKRFGKIDVLVNNAGYAALGAFESSTKEQIKRQFDVNVFGMMDVTKAILPHFRENKDGLIINISSMGGRITLPALSLYHSTKFAVEGFSESLAYELSVFNIKVKLVEPGGVQTNFGSTSMDFIKTDIPEYENFFNKYLQNYRKPTQHLKTTTPLDVANVIYNAASSADNQFRYVVGADAEMLIEGKTQLSDTEYIKRMNDLYVNNI